MNINFKRFFTATLALSFAVFSVLSLSNCKKDEDDETEKPTASFTYTVNGMEVTFTFTGDNADSYSWDFGDGNTDDAQNPVHTYAAAGTYTVELTAENAGGTDTETQDVVIEPAPAPNPAPSFGDADGAFIAINTVTNTSAGGFEVQLKLGSAVAWFIDENDEFVSVGDVTFDGAGLSGTLEFNDNNTYSWLEEEQPSSGFSNNGGVLWSIDGGSGHGQINNISNGYPFPSIKKIANTEETISGSSSFTLSHDGAINDADSTFYSIYGASGNIMKRVAGSTTSVSFTAAEMGELGAGTAILQIASFKIVNQTLGSTSPKKYYMINESVASKIVTVE